MLADLKGHHDLEQELERQGRAGKDITAGRRTIEEMQLRMLEAGKHLVVEESVNNAGDAADKRTRMFEVVVSLVQDNTIYVRKLYSNDVFALDLKSKHRIVNELA